MDPVRVQTGNTRSGHIHTGQTYSIETQTGNALPVQAHAGETHIGKIQTSEDENLLDDITGDLAKRAKSYRDAIWRWATIGISCAGGLVSGWLGSAISNQAGDFFRSGMEMVSEKAVEAAGLPRQPPIAGKIRQAASAEKAASRDTEKGAAGVTGGKGDRIMPVNEKLCTVLEMDRSMGLTLVRPCRNQGAATLNNSTLGKSDLMARPQ